MMHDLALDVDDLALGRRLHDGRRRGELDLELAARLDTIRYCDLHRLTSSRVHNPHRLAWIYSRRAGHYHRWAHRLGVNYRRGDGLVVGWWL